VKFMMKRDIYVNKPKNSSLALSGNAPPGTAENTSKSQRLNTSTPTMAGSLRQ
jgi:hypothetical protein